jgi:hypothetical protein
MQVHESSRPHSVTASPGLTGGPEHWRRDRAHCPSPAGDPRPAIRGRGPVGIARPGQALRLRHRRATVTSTPGARAGGRRPANSEGSGWSRADRSRCNLRLDAAVDRRTPGARGTLPALRRGHGLVSRGPARPGQPPVTPAGSAADHDHIFTKSPELSDEDLCLMAATGVTGSSSDQLGRRRPGRAGRGGTVHVTVTSLAGCAAAGP